MIRGFTVKLLNVFSQICFHTFDIIFLEKIIQVDLFRHHALALHDGSQFFAWQILRISSRACLCSFRPDHLRTAPCNI